jgi:glycosyltransferase involved in cell wall biosynthesis
LTVANPNVLWLAHAVPYPPRAGFLSRSYHLLRALARRQTVDLVAFIQEPWLTTLFPSLEEGLDESRRALEEFCRSVTFLPIDRLKPRGGKALTGLTALLSGSTYTTTWLVSTPARNAIARMLRARRYGLIHCDTIGLAPYRGLAAEIPATLTHHNIESHMMLRRAENARSALARHYFQHEGHLLLDIERRIARDFEAHITCSELDSARLKETAPDANTAVIPNGVDCEYFVSRDVPARPDSVIFVGTMNWYPNIQAMLFFLRQVWPGLKARVPRATMDIAGTNPPKDVTELAQALPDVTVHGYVPDVRPLLDAAAVFVCPIMDGGGTKLKLLDAFAMGKCVVAHPVACEGIGVTPGHDVVLASSAEEFVREIEALLADEQRRRRIGRAARELAEREYSFDGIGARFNDLVEQVLFSRTAAAPQ